MAKARRDLIKLESTAGTGVFYTTTKNKRNTPDKITVSTNGDDARKPSFAIRRVGSDVSVAFAGIPLGHEFTSLVIAILNAAGKGKLPDAALARLVDQAEHAFPIQVLPQVQELYARKAASAQ